MTFENSLQEVVAFVKSLPNKEFSLRNTTKEAVLSNTDRLEWVAQEHRKCVLQYGVDRKWSLQDAVMNAPGVF